MATEAINRVMDRVRQTALAMDDGERTDAQLLDQYLAARDDAAFEALLRRHGPLVLGVCRRVLGHEADAHDAFQATFLVFVRKAGSIRTRERLANWLYGVAFNTARKAKAMNRTRRSKEGQAINASRRDAGENLLREVQELLDTELHRLPETYRLPILLCDLEGRTLKEAAGHLGWPAGTVATRLRRGRALLARRLTQRGLTLSGAVLAAALAPGARAGVPALLVTSTVRAASLFAAGQAATIGLVSPTVAALTEGVLKSMSPSQLKIVATLLIALVAIAATAGRLTPIAQAEKPTARLTPSPETPPKDDAAGNAHAAYAKQLESMAWNLTQFDPDKNTINVSDSPVTGLNGGLSRARYFALPFDGPLMLDGLEVAKDAKITVDGKECQLKDLHVGMEATLKLAAEKLVVTAIEAKSLRNGHVLVLKAVNAEKNTISVTIDKDGALQDLPVAKKVYIYLYDIGNECKLSDLAAGMRVTLKVTIDNGRLVVRDIRARK